MGIRHGLGKKYEGDWVGSCPRKKCTESWEKLEKWLDDSRIFPRKSKVVNQHTELEQGPRATFTKFLPTGYKRDSFHSWQGDCRLGALLGCVVTFLEEANHVFQKSGVIDDEQLDAIGWGASHQPVKWDPFLKEDQAMQQMYGQLKGFHLIMYCLGRFLTMTPGFVKNGLCVPADVSKIGAPKGFFSSNSTCPVSRYCQYRIHHAKK